MKNKNNSSIQKSVVKIKGYLPFLRNFQVYELGRMDLKFNNLNCYRILHGEFYCVFRYNLLNCYQLLRKPPYFFRDKLFICYKILWSFDWFYYHLS
jgi:hypothetical protein